ncbi:hypothetical protein F4806DRAFT_477574 [Annulohypoxylon nitens]|nr:hypothetical protein F4806DRAFT_477574 [Annulohypoxylon nitens]
MTNILASNSTRILTGQDTLSLLFENTIYLVDIKKHVLYPDSLIAAYRLEHTEPVRNIRTSCIFFLWNSEVLLRKSMGQLLLWMIRAVDMLISMCLREGGRFCAMIFVRSGNVVLNLKRSVIAATVNQRYKGT